MMGIGATNLEAFLCACCGSALVDTVSKDRITKPDLDEL